MHILTFKLNTHEHARIRTQTTFAYSHIHSSTHTYRTNLWLPRADASSHTTAKTSNYANTMEWVQRLRVNIYTLVVLPHNIFFCVMSFKCSF